MSIVCVDDTMTFSSSSLILVQFLAKSKLLRNSSSEMEGVEVYDIKLNKCRFSY